MDTVIECCAPIADELSTECCAPIADELSTECCAPIVDELSTECCAPIVDELSTECCAPIVDEPLAAAQAERLAAWFGVLADPTRLRLLSLIAAKGEACAACEMVEPLGVSQPTVSHHLKVLRQAGLVTSEKRGRWVYYCPVPERLAALSHVLRV